MQQNCNEQHKMREKNFTSSNVKLTSYLYSLFLNMFVDGSYFYSVASYEYTEDGIVHMLDVRVNTCYLGQIFSSLGQLEKSFVKY